MPLTQSSSGIATLNIFKLISFRTLGRITIKIKVAIANLVAKKSLTGWRSSASFMRTKAAPQTAVTAVNPIIPQIRFWSFTFSHVTSLGSAPLRHVLVRRQGFLGLMERFASLDVALIREMVQYRYDLDQ